MNNDEILIEKGSPLLNLHPDQKLWVRWLSANYSEVSGMTSAFHGANGTRVPSDERPEDTGNSFPENYASQLIEDLDNQVSDKEERQLITNSILSLKSGSARAVVTGQQPGFAGGPLYSLFKIATTVALANRRTNLGQPSVPVFWLGDDDDDWQELLDPVFWNSNEGELFRSDLTTGPRRSRKNMIGSIPFSPLEDSVLDALENCSNSFESDFRLLDIYKKSKDSGSSLSDLTEKVLRSVFKGTGLVILRGNDARLHAECGTFYEMAMKKLPELTRVTMEQGQLMAELHGIHPLNTNSLTRPLYVAEGDKRHPWDGETVPDDPSHWRCGVLLRSMLQDWMLNPAAVVVGPGELAYLSQLIPAYDSMGIVRSPLVPRLFGWILPPDLPLKALQAFTHDSPLDDARCLDLAEVAGQAGEVKLVQLLKEELGLSGKRAEELAAGRTRRWVKGVQALLKNESQKQTKSKRPSKPEWVFPEGVRQERKLAWIPVAAIFGKPLIDAVLEASSKHLEDGSGGVWNEFLFRVPESEFLQMKGSGE